MTGITNSQRSFARTGVHFLRVQEELSGEVDEIFSASREKVIGLLMKYFRKYSIETGEGERIWNYLKLRRDGADEKFIREMKGIIREMIHDVTGTSNRWSLAAAREAYQRVIHELGVAYPDKSKIVSNIPSIKTVAGTMLEKRNGQELLKTNEDLGQNLINSSLKTIVNKWIDGANMDDTIGTVERSYRGGKFRSTATNILHEGVSVGRERAIDDNTEIIEDRLWLTLKDGHMICAICQPLHLKQAEPIINKYSEPPIHPNCYCYTLINVQKIGAPWVKYNPQINPYADVGLKNLGDSESAADKLAKRQSKRPKKKKEPRIPFLYSRRK